MGIGFRELLVILLIALVLFGAKKLKSVGSDLGAAVRGFKKVHERRRGRTEQAAVRPERSKDADFAERAPSKSDSKPSA